MFLKQRKLLKARNWKLSREKNQTGFGKRHHGNQCDKLLLLLLFRHFESIQVLEWVVTSLCPAEATVVLIFNNQPWASVLIWEGFFARPSPDRFLCLVSVAWWQWTIKILSHSAADPVKFEAGRSVCAPTTRCYSPRSARFPSGSSS